jgi:hypothetical protein
VKVRLLIECEFRSLGFSHTLFLLFAITRFAIIQREGEDNGGDNDIAQTTVRSSMALAFVHVSRQYFMGLCRVTSLSIPRLSLDGCLKWSKTQLGSTK